MELKTKDGGAKILKHCMLPLTETAPGIGLEEIRARTEAPFSVSPTCREMRLAKDA